MSDDAVMSILTWATRKGMILPPEYRAANSETPLATGKAFQLVSEKEFNRLMEEDK